MKLRSYISFLVCLLCSQTLLCATPFEEGVTAHKEKNYEDAITHFKEAFELNPNNVAAYYNYGVSCMSHELYSEAFWAFEKVLKLTPNDSEAKENAEYAYIQLHTDKEYNPVLNNFQSGLYSFSSNMWSIITILSAFLFGLSIVFFKKNSKVGIKRICLLSSVFLVLIFFSTLSLSYSVKDYASSINYGVIVGNDIPYFIESSSTAVGNIEVGNRLEIIDIADSICSVRFEDNTVQIKTTDIALI